MPSPIPIRLLTANKRLMVAATGVIAVATASSCGGSAPARAPGPASSLSPAPAASPGGPVLPVRGDPITNGSTNGGLKLDSVQVENNVDPANRPVSDHIEVTAENTTASPLGGFEVFYTVRDPRAGLSESYYAKLPAAFMIGPGSKRTISFDNTGAPDHFPVNKFGLYYTSKDALDIKVEVSASGVAVQTISAHKAAGGAENTSQ